mgnify:CR=1 FL=1
MVRGVIRIGSISFLVVAVVLLLGSLLWRMVIRPPVSAERQPGSGRVIQLRVLNGAGVPDLARQVQQYLRRRGFDVVEATNAPTPQPQSLVLDHYGDSLAAARVCYALGLAPTAVRQEIDSDLVLNCSVIIGYDWQQLRPFR